MSKKSKQQTNAGTRSEAPASTRIIDRFESLGNHGVWVVLSIAALMLTYIYWDFITGAKVLLFKDIGSDSINIFYPIYVQWTKLWSAYSTSSGFSLETVMGQATSFNVWDPFSWLIAAGGTESITKNLAFGEMLKAVVSSVLGYFFFRFQKLTNLSSTIGALCLGFSGYIALGASGWYVHSMEVVSVAFALWAVEYSLAKKPLYIVVFPAAIFYLAKISGFFTIYLAAALFVYIVVRLATEWDGRKSMPAGAIQLGLLFLGLALSYDVFASTLSMVNSSGRAESIKAAGAVSSYGTKMDVSMFETAPRAEYSNILLRAYSNNLMGTGNGFRGMMNYLEAPLLYYGLAMLLFLPFFFVGQDKRTRIAYGVLLGAVLMLLIFPWFRFAFWGFRLDYFREYTMLIGAVLLILAMRGLNTFVAAPGKTHTWLAPVATLVAIVLPFTLAKPATLIDPSQKTSLVLLLLGLGGVATAYAVTRRKDLLLGLVVLASIDLSYNAYTTINKRDLLTTQEIDQGMLYGGSSLKAINWIKSQNTAALYRIAKFTPSGPTMHSSLNDAMVQGFNGVVGYSSFHNKYYLRFMEKLECRDVKNPSDAKWVYKVITRPYLASMLGVKYFLVNDRPMGFDEQLFPAVKQIDNIYIHEAKTALPLLVAYDSYITEDEFATQQNGRPDYMLFKAAVLGSADVASVGSAAHYNLSTDTVRNVRSADFAIAAAERTSMMQVSTKPTKNGLDATIDLKRDGIVVIQIPFDENLTVTVDGKPAKTFVANLGFVGIKESAGRHNVSIAHTQ
jgi:hypothetical protein